MIQRKEAPTKNVSLAQGPLRLEWRVMEKVILYRELLTRWTASN